jgi:membrane-associated phospholipid phosphatase
MMKQPYFTAASSLLLLGWAAVLLGFNMNFTWWAHHTYSASLDDFFIHFSWMAEWALIVAAASVALIRDKKRALFMGLTLGIQALVVAGIKSVINAPRPIEINHDWVRNIPTLEIHHWQAFPSGHTAVAFFTMGWLWLNYPRTFKNPQIVGLVLALLAAGIGYSRMYLAQHSLIDVCAGGTLALCFLMLGDALGRKWRIHE